VLDRIVRVLLSDASGQLKAGCERRREKDVFVDKITNRLGWYELWIGQLIYTASVGTSVMTWGWKAGPVRSREKTKLTLKVQKLWHVAKCFIACCFVWWSVQVAWCKPETFKINQTTGNWQRSRKFKHCRKIWGSLAWKCLHPHLPPPYKHFWTCTSCDIWH